VIPVKRKLLLLEVNEVPYRVIDAYCSLRPSSNLARLLARSAQYETVTEDKLALDPWISWPTFHRGVNDEQHQILHLGQVIEDTDLKYPPIWRILKAKGLSVGVFGSLHSSAIPEDASTYSFYVPDYFGTNPFAHPKELLPFQVLNLAMTRQSARNVSRKMPVSAFARFLVSAPSLGLTLRTVADSSSHLLREAFNKSLRIRRRAYQPLVMADLFLQQLERTQPDFVTFYTNHVAAAMHRYWGAAFPMDYAQPLDQKWINQYSGEITFAMDKLDVILGRMLRFIDQHPEYVLMAASSMGQAAIPAEKTFEFLTITDLSKFMAHTGAPSDAWEARPAMVPCQCVVIREEYRDQVLRAVKSLSLDGAKFKEANRPTAPMSYDERERGFFQFFVQFDNYRGTGHASIGSKTVPLSEIGLGITAHEDGVNCTAQHVPEGSLFVYGAGTTATGIAGRKTISTLAVTPSIMKYFDFDPLTHMCETASILGESILPSKAAA
jgi:hypothetical protein